MAVDLNTVVKQLTDSGIVAQGKLENFVPPKANPKSVDELVAELVKNNHLTQFQAAQVKAGKAKSLILGEYTILDKIGAGGMGQVFKAQHRRMKRLVAIKMLPPAMTKDAQALARFEREVEAAAKLRHPNIVAADDAGQANGVHFLVMEYVDGKDLSATVKKDGPLPVNKAVNYIVQAARGLEFAHSEGVVHRDIKPANLLLDQKGVVKILDMGLARIEEADGGAAAELTGTGTIMGTVDYMSPEQALNTKNADARADIYSLGISLYYLLSGKAAYAGETAMEKLMAHQNQPIPSLQDVQTTIPKQLDVVFKKMVAKAPGERYQSMSEVIEALSGLGYGSSSATSPTESAGSFSLSSADRKKLKPTGTKTGIGSLTQVVASEKSKNFVFKIVGGAFGTIIAPILVFYLIRHLEKEDKSAAPPAANAPAAAPVANIPATSAPTVVATNTVSQPPAIAESSSPKPMEAPFDAAAAKAGQAAWAKHLGTQVETTNSIGMRMTLIPPGEFMMGSTQEQVAAAKKMGEDENLKPADGSLGRLSAELPQHKVTISLPFLMGSTEVSIGQFKRFVEATKYVTEAEQYGFGNSSGKTIDDKVKESDKGKNWKSSGYAVTDESPVSQITWNDACAFCAWLSEHEQRRPWYRTDGKGGWQIADYADGYRLPTEAEWEYACRAGTTTQFSFGDDKSLFDQYGWYSKNSSGKAHSVAMKRPNGFGLFDMHGNAHEWCQDWYDAAWYEKSSSSDPLGLSSGGYRVIRGGHWGNLAFSGRSAFRFNYPPSSRLGNYGFRIVRPLDGSTSLTPGPTQPATAVATTAKPSASPAKPTKSWETPEFQKWIADTQKFPADKQIEAVSKKLMELNPGFDGVLYGNISAQNSRRAGQGKPGISRGAVSEVAIVVDEVTDISPVRVFAGGLTRLSCVGTVTNQKGRLSDLSPLQGLALTNLSCTHTQVANLTPLQGMKLTKLNLDSTSVADLSPLGGMPLETLNCAGTEVRDLAPVAGMPLTSLTLNNNPNLTDLSPLAGMKLAQLLCSGTRVSDISALAGMPLAKLHCSVATDLTPLARMSLTDLQFSPKVITRGLEIVRGMQSLETISIAGDSRGPMPAAEFWKRYDAGEFGKPEPSKKLAYLDPAFQKWIADTQKLPAEQQIEAVSKKLMELNPGFDGKLRGYDQKELPKIEIGAVKEIGFWTDNVTDISPVRSLTELRWLDCRGSQAGKGVISDVSPLEGMRLEHVYLSSTKVSNLSPLVGMPLKRVLFAYSEVSDLSPLKGMKLENLDCTATQVSDLSPLAGMPLTYLLCSTKTVSDISPLANCKDLAFLHLGSAQVTAAQVAALQKALPNCKIKRDNPAQSTTPKKLAYLDPSFQQWVAETQKLPAEQQIEAVSKKLMELNPGFDGKVIGAGGKDSTRKIENGVVRELGFFTDHVTDISPVRAFAGLKGLGCGGSPGSNGGVATSGLSDISPLQGMPLEKLYFPGTNVTSLEPLRGMPLTSLLCTGSPISDLSPLEGMRLTSLHFQIAFRISDLTALRGMPLTDLSCGDNPIVDLSPLRAMPLTFLSCSQTPVADLSPLQECKNLKRLIVMRTKVTPAQVAALQKALPDCRIEWDDPAKANSSDKK
jgi:serine/threonine-protein kinase